jgi:photosystem II stability/assembly factor-like uncharacterized protein
MFKFCLVFSLFILLNIFSFSQKIKILTSGQSLSIRGLCAVSDQVIWVSGSGGTVGLSIDEGNTWKWMHVPGMEKSDFRDIEAFSETEAVIMGITEPAILMRTFDGGKTWATVFEDTAKSAFLDAMDFSGDQGVVIGDPEGGKILFARSEDRGKSWEVPSRSGLDTTAAGETFFAASGSNIRLLSGNRWVLVSGGKKSCLYIGEGRHPLLLNQGAETTGANSIAVNPSDPNQAFVVGGDFSRDTLRQGSSLLLQLSPFRQGSPKTPPRGYRSCVEYLNAKKMICCGTSGVDISTDGGTNWKGISDQSFHVCRKAKSGKTIYLAGTRGVIARLIWD